MTNFYFRYLFLSLFILPWAAQAQHTGTRADSSFLAERIYSPASVSRAMQLSDGSRLLIGYINRAEGQPAMGLVRYLPSGQLDAVFNTNVRAYGWADGVMAEGPGRTLYMGLSQPRTINGQTRFGLVRLNANGTLDAGFTPTLSSTSTTAAITALVVQADGKVVISDQGTSGRLTRLNPDGSLDQSFTVQQGAGANGGCYTLLVQPDGKILLGGGFTQVQGAARGGIARLNADGSLDAGFVPPANNSPVRQLVRQPDGKILVLASGGLGTGVNNLNVARLLANGAIDPSFQVDRSIYPADSYAPNEGAKLVIQPDGRILVAVSQSVFSTNTTSYQGYMVRLLANGTKDSSWQSNALGNYQAGISSIEVLSSGEVLVAGAPRQYTASMPLPVGVAVLSSTGSYVASGFSPQLQAVGAVYNFARQANGQIVAGGSFSEVNGAVAHNIARFNADGSLDASFGANCLTDGPYPTVGQVILQPDGKFLIAGSFATVGGLPRQSIARLLPTGQVDPSFTSPFQAGPPMSNAAAVDYLSLQADGKVLVSGSGYLPGSIGNPALIRLNQNGTVDNTFQVPSGYVSFGPVLVLPNGSIMAAGYSFSSTSGGPVTTESIIRLLPNGSLDPSFVLTPSYRQNQAQILGFLLYPDGRLLAYGNFQSFGGVRARQVVRLLPNGQRDTSFDSQLTNVVPFTGAIQPDGRILLGGGLYVGSPSSSPTVVRLLPTGALDPDFTRSQTVLDSFVSYLELLPSGGFLLAGGFMTVTGQERHCLARMLDAGLPAPQGPRPAASEPKIWPVPAHNELNLQLNADAQPTQVELINSMGQAVRTQPITNPDFQLSTAGLRPGMYVLRIRYAQADTVTRRIELE